MTDLFFVQKRNRSLNRSRGHARFHDDGARDSSRGWLEHDDGAYGRRSTQRRGTLGKMKNLFLDLAQT